MKCPKCGHENPNDVLFCEECDWKVTEKPRKERSENFYLYISVATVVLGLASLILAIVNKTNADAPNFGLWSVILGGIGLVAASFSLTSVRIRDVDDRMKKTVIAISAVAQILSVIGFVVGLSVMLS